MKSHQEFWNCKSIHTPLFSISPPARMFSPLHWHEACEIILMTSGQVAIDINGTDYFLKRGDIVIINSMELHSTKAITENTSILMIIPTDLWKEYTDSATPPVFSNLPTAPEPLKQSLLTMAEACPRDRNCTGFTFYQEMFSFLQQLYDQRLPMKPSTPRHLSLVNTQRLQLLTDYLENHYTERLSLAQAAELLHLQPNYFCRFMKNCTGKSFQEYVNHYRFIKICDDILNTQDPVQDILDRHVFFNEKVFRRLFHQQYHCTPTQLRLRNQEIPSSGNPDNIDCF